MKVGFHYGALCDPLEKQANDQGFTLGKDKDILQKLNDSMIMCWIYGLCTDAQKDAMMKKLQKRIVNSLNRKEGDI